MDIEITHQDNGRTGRFYVSKDGIDLAEMVYKWDDGFINILHTEVDDQLRGQNTGIKLVAAAVHWARERGIKIMATCPFARAVLEKKAEYHDVYVPLLL